MRLAAALLLLAACTETGEPTGPFVTSRVVRQEVAFPQSWQVDLLFVVDSSPAMAPYRDKVLASVDPWLSPLASERSGRLDLHVGVITSDVGACSGAGDDGALRGGSGVTGSYLSDVGTPLGTRLRNYTGTLRDNLREMLDAGNAGCGTARPFEAIQRALANPHNAGFFRERAYLSIIFVTASDDMSITTPGGSPVDVSSIADALKSRTLDPSRTSVLAITAQPAPRIRALLDQFPNRNSETALDAGDQQAALTTAFTLPHIVPARGCWATRVIEDACAGWVTVHGVERSVPACEPWMTTLCYRHVPCVESWGTPSGQGLDLVNADNFRGPGLSGVTVECLAADDSSDGNP